MGGNGNIGYRWSHVGASAITLVGQSLHYDENINWNLKDYPLGLNDNSQITIDYLNHYKPMSVSWYDFIPFSFLFRGLSLSFFYNSLY